MAAPTSVYFRIDAPDMTDDDATEAGTMLMDAMDHTNRLVPLKAWGYIQASCKTRSSSYNLSTRTLRFVRALTSCNAYALLKVTSSNLITEDVLRQNILEAMKGLPPRYMDVYAKWTFTSLTAEDFRKMRAQSELSVGVSAYTDDDDCGDGYEDSDD